MDNEQILRNDLFKLTMQKKWEEVETIYENPKTHEIKLTKSGDTAFHVAVSSYNSKCPDPRHEACTERMISLMIKYDKFSQVLKSQNAKGDTPLHIAAAVGWKEMCTHIAVGWKKMCTPNADKDTKEMCTRIADNEDKTFELIEIRNKKGETPLFIAAHHGNLEAFRSLNEFYVGERRDEGFRRRSLRRADGNTVLHSAVSGEYFRLAYLILEEYNNLISASNVEGETPLHVLARKPNIFHSSSHLGLYESIIYKCVFVDDLKQPKRNPRADKHDPIRKQFPENYLTCVNIFFLLWDPIYNSFKASSRQSSAAPTDEENRHVEDQTDRAEKKSSTFNVSLPPNYATCFSLFKFATKVILTVLGIGFSKVRKIQEMKVMNSHAMVILEKMIESEPSYMYGSNGQRPVTEQKPHPEEALPIPEIPPGDDEHKTPSSAEAENKTTSSARDHPKSDNKNEKGQNQVEDKTTKETPFLVAAKMGILEMVKKIHCEVPVAIQDHDSEGKNVVMLAAEFRQTSVFDYLMQSNLPDYVFQHVDNKENSILHLAAKLGEKKPWRIPGAALQMQWELKWFKHVKSSIRPLSFSHHNAENETPRQIFMRTHEGLVQSGNGWLVKTAESCSLVAALIATVAFATSATVPGGLNEGDGSPKLEGRECFDIFSIASLVALCLSVTALVFFLAIITSRFEERDFKRDLPRKLLIGLTCLFSSIAAMLLSFCAGHTFILREKMRIVAVPIYAATTIPVAFFVVVQLPLYSDLLSAACRKVPLRSYKVFH